MSDDLIPSDVKAVLEGAPWPVRLEGGGSECDAHENVREHFYQMMRLLHKADSVMDEACEEAETEQSVLAFLWFDFVVENYCHNLEGGLLGLWKQFLKIGEIPHAAYRRANGGGAHPLSIVKDDMDPRHDKVTLLVTNMVTATHYGARGHGRFIAKARRPDFHNTHLTFEHMVGQTLQFLPKALELYHLQNVAWVAAVAHDKNQLEATLATLYTYQVAVLAEFITLINAHNQALLNKCSTVNNQLLNQWPRGHLLLRRDTQGMGLERRHYVDTAHFFKPSLYDTGADQDIDTCRA
jgi:hypothetical protein